VYLFAGLYYVKLKRTARASGTTPPLTGRTKSFRLPFQFGWNRQQHVRIKIALTVVSFIKKKLMKCKF
jgi:hypothetical protein